MKDITMKKSGDSWVVRRTYNRNGLSWWKTTICDNFGNAVVTYLKFMIESKKKSR